LRFSEGFSGSFFFKEGFKYLDLSFKGGESKASTHISINMLEKVFSTYLKVLGGGLGLFFSLIPYSVFKVKSFQNTFLEKSLPNQDLGGFFIALKTLREGRIIFCKDKSKYFSSSTFNVEGYWRKKSLFFKKNDLFLSYLFKFSDLLFLEIFTKPFSKLLRLNNTLRVNTFIKQTNWKFYNLNKYTNIRVYNFFNFYFLGLKFF